MAQAVQDEAEEVRDDEVEEDTQVSQTAVLWERQCHLYRQAAAAFDQEDLTALESLISQSAVYEQQSRLPRVKVCGIAVHQHVVDLGMQTCLGAHKLTALWVLDAIASSPYGTQQRGHFIVVVPHARIAPVTLDKGRSVFRQCTFDDVTGSVLLPMRMTMPQRRFDGYHGPGFCRSWI